MYKFVDNYFSSILSLKIIASQINGQTGTDVMIFKIFSPENLAKKLAFLTQTKAKF
jgi:hypothetical protein